jgi:predicted RNA-binding protein with PUA-like domain
MKSEPDAFGIDDLHDSPRRVAHWDGCRNYQVRNMMRDEMKKGDLALFYHSSCKPPGVAGIMEIAREGYPDHTAFDPEDPHYDPKSDPDKPRWYMVDVRFVEKFERLVTLTELKREPALSGMQILQRGNRLSITPVSKREWNTIMKKVKSAKAG